jgi:hypothetical protein
LFVLMILAHERRRIVHVAITDSPTVLAWGRRHFRRGGSAFNTVEMARNFEAALKRAGKPVEAKYYQQGGHNAFFSDAAQRDDEVRRRAAFYRRHLRS